MSSSLDITINDDSLKSLLSHAVEYARGNGADQVEVAASNDKGYSVTARLGEVETVEHHNQRSMGVTVYRGKAKGAASTNIVSSEAINRAIDSALEIAKFTAEDDCAGLADAELMATDYPQLDLDHPWDIEPDSALEQAILCEQVARDDKRVVNSEGASVSSINTHLCYANSHGFTGEYRGTRHSISCSVIAGDDKGMQRDYWYAVDRNANNLEDVESVGAMARERTVRRLGARGMKTCSVPILFEPSLARSLVGHLVSAISGGALYRQASFLVDSINKKILPSWLTITEDPHMIGGLGSVPFDNEGVRTQSRNVVEDGVLQGYVLSSYSARKLGMQTTANAGGVHNIQMTHSNKSQQDLLNDMGTGLLVTELIGHGVNTVTGDYSRGASGFWVENGEIQYPVEEITVAGNLEDMFMNIAAIGNDTDRRGNIQCGSILVDNMTVAGGS
ncbi:MAG: metalloprotease PmbA [Gammaproteobacteria bacterium]|nr:metalloprotease PmbA [Gammaproteobacteria bacterium]